MPYILIGRPGFNIYADELCRYDFTPIPLPPENRLSKTVQTHADTLIFSDGTTHIVNAEYAKLLPKNISERMKKAPETPFGAYPDDTAFNALPVGRYLFARLASLSPTVRSTAEENGLMPVNVKQGYARCSTLALRGARAAVTADEGMAKVLESHGIRVLRISPGHIELSGCDYGFIGGASFVHEPYSCCSLHETAPTVYFFGNLRTHPDCDKIERFLSGFGYRTVCLGGKLTDYGGAVILS